MELRSVVVAQLDRHAPGMMLAARYRLHVSCYGEIVYPSVTRPLFERLKSRTATAIDVGANVGIFSMYLSKHFREVVAVEPIPRLARQLQRALPLNCRALALALGDNEGVVNMRVPIDLAGRAVPALATLSEHNRLELIPKRGVTVHAVQCQRIDTVAAAMNSLVFVKIDVEGFEGEVLRGATQLLSQQRPVLQIEIGRAHNPRYEDVFYVMSELRFSTFAMLKHGVSANIQRYLIEQPMAVSEANSASPPGCWDFLFVPNEKVDELLAGLIVE